MIPAVRNSLFLPLAGMLVLSGCLNAESGTAVEKKPGKRLLIGLVPEQNLFRQMERYQPLADYISDRTGFEIKLTVFPRYRSAVESFSESRLDAAFLGSFTYALAHARLGLQVLARPERIDGTSTYHGLIFVRRDSMITSIEQMKGKRLALVDKATTAGYLLPLAYFRKHGFNHRTELREIYYTGTHEDTIYDVLKGKADIGAAKNTVYERLADIDSSIQEKLVVLERSPAVPENALAVRRDLDMPVKQLLAEVLLTMHNDEEGRKVLRQFGARRFIVTVDSDYLPVYQYAGKAGINLTRYACSSKKSPQTAVLNPLLPPL